MEKCLSDGQLAGAIIGSIVGTLAICVGIAFALFYFFWRNRGNAPARGNKVAPADVESTIRESLPGTPKKSMRDQVTMIDSFRLERKSFGTQKSFSVENVNDVEAAVFLKADDLNGLGFNIKGNMTDGIYVKNVTPKGPADLCGNILVDDRIRSLTISFDGMVYEDAVTLLSYASPYQVKFVLERRLADGFTTVDHDSNLSPRVHPLFRSNTLTHCHFNPGSPSITPSPPPLEEALCPEPESKPMSPEPIGDRQDSPVHIAPEPPMSPVPVIIVEKPESPTIVEPTVVEEKKMVSSDYSSDHSCKEDEKSSETSSDSLADSAHSIEEKIEVISPVPSQRITSPSPPVKQAAKELPPKKAARESGIPIKRTPTQKRDGTSSSPPTMTEVRVSRIPKRADSIKTPIMERKLPPLPKSALQKRESAADPSDIWSRLYQEKKGALRKTRDVTSPLPPSQNNNNNEATANSSSPVPPARDEYGTLNRERRDRLAENDDILERQQEELRQLGIL